MVLIDDPESFEGLLFKLLTLYDRSYKNFFSLGNWFFV